MSYPVAITWQGLKGEEMAEVYSRIGPSLGKSPVAPPKKRKKSQTVRKQGLIETFDAARSYGFIRVKGEKDVYFHTSDAIDSVMRGDRVSFEPGEDSLGRPCAKDVRLIN